MYTRNLASDLAQLTAETPANRPGAAAEEGGGAHQDHRSFRARETDDGLCPGQDPQEHRQAASRVRPRVQRKVLPSREHDGEKLREKFLMTRATLARLVAAHEPSPEPKTFC